MTDVQSQNQEFAIPAPPEAQYVTITVTSAFSNGNNGFSDVHFLGEKGKFPLFPIKFYSNFQIKNVLIYFSKI